MPRSVLIVDDNDRVRTIMRHFFETRTDWKVGGEAEDGSEAIQKAEKLKPDLILLDFSMPNMNGIEAASLLKKMSPDTHIIVFTMFDGAVSSRLSSVVGIDIVVPKAEGLTGLVKAVEHLTGTIETITGQARVDRESTPERTRE
jgi:DNA-binding NarL/FixJ family response regulator